MLARVLALCLALVPALAFAQSVMLPGFPPGTFVSRAALDTGSAPTYQGPGDINGTPANGWGLRGYNAAYRGKAINVCTPAPVCADINIVSGGGLDTAALATLGCNNTTSVCNIATLYDQPNQAGTPHDLVQATGAHQPVLVVPGVSNGCPSNGSYCIHFNAFGQNLTSVANVTSISAPFTISYVAERDSSDLIALQDTNNANFVRLTSTTADLSSAAGSFSSSAIAASTYHAVQNISNGASSSIYVDGTNSTGSVVTTGAFNGQAEINANGAFETEAWIWQGDKSANNAAVNSQQHSYWGF